MDHRYEAAMMMSGGPPNPGGMLHSHHAQHIGMDALNINPAALLYSPTGTMMRVSSGMLAPTMLQAALPPTTVLPPHSPTRSSVPLTGLMTTHKEKALTLTYDDDPDSPSGDEGQSDGTGESRKRSRVETVERKTKKCAMERKRRKDLNEGFHGLRQALPLTISRPSKTTLLHYAVDYIKQLEVEISNLRDENRQLRKAMTGA